MECKHCGTPNPDGSMFCLNCGQTLTQQSCLDAEAAASAEAATPETSPVFTEEPASETVDAPGAAVCPVCGTAVEDGTVFCSNCGANISPVSAPDAVLSLSAFEKSTAKKKPKKVKKILLTIGLVIAALLVVFVIVGICTNWFGLNGPLTQIASATEKTFSKHNFSADFTIEVDGEEFEGTVFFDMDVENEIIHMLLNAEHDGDEIIIAIYDDHLIYGSEDNLSSIDVSMYISSICDAIEYSKDSSMSFDEAWDRLIDLIPNKKQEEINDDYVKLDTLKKLIKTFFIKKLNNASWLKENAGYSTESENGIKMHKFEPEVGPLLVASAEHFESAFAKSSVYDDVMDFAEDAEEYTEDWEIYVGFGIKGGKLVLLEAAIGEDEFVSVSCSFYDIGKTTLNEDELDDLLDDADMNY